MAIASIVLHTLMPDLDSALEGLRKIPGLDANKAACDRIAAIIEVPAVKLLDTLNACANSPMITELELVYVNYEDDLDSDGFINCGCLEELRTKLAKTT